MLDCGVGNLHSLRKALEKAGAHVTITTEGATIANADAIVLPGVGAFGAASEQLAPHRETILHALDQGKPLLGICLGMQLLFETSEESPGAQGLGYIRGVVEKLKAPKLPQIGWNELAFRDDPLFQGIREAELVYFVNSFAPVPREPVTLATATYGSSFTAVVRKRNAYGLQFHPEKSSTAGIHMVENWVRIAEAAA
ncbi:MAG: imidazole glycerol phosphate synthase subunit HisH [Thermoplasmatota archaeon]